MHANVTNGIPLVLNFHIICIIRFYSHIIRLPNLKQFFSANFHLARLCI